MSAGRGATSGDAAYDKRTLEVGQVLPRYNAWHTGELAPHISGHVIEVGAGLGTIAATYVDRVASAVLLEPAPNLYEELDGALGGHPHVTTLCAYLDDLVGTVTDHGVRFDRPTFDTALMVNVLEHIEDDGATLRQLRTLLAPDGRLVLFVPAGPVLYGTLDRTVGHHRRYTRGSLAGVVTGAGYRITRLEPFDLLGALPWFVTGRILRRSHVAQGGAGAYDRVAVPVCRLADRLVGPPWGKNLICVAEPS